MSHCDLQKFFKDIAKQMFIVECMAVIVSRAIMKILIMVSVVSFLLKKKKKNQCSLCVYLIFGQIGAAVITFKGGE